MENIPTEQKSEDYCLTFKTEKKKTRKWKNEKTRKIGKTRKM